MTEKKEQTIGGSNISLRGGELITTEEKEIIMPPEKAKKLQILTAKRLEIANDMDIQEILVGSNEVIKGKDGSVTRIDSKTGKVLTGKLLEEMEK